MHTGLVRSQQITAFICIKAPGWDVTEQGAFPGKAGGRKASGCCGDDCEVTKARLWLQVGNEQQENMNFEETKYTDLWQISKEIKPEGRKKLMTSAELLLNRTDFQGFHEDTIDLIYQSRTWRVKLKTVPFPFLVLYDSLLQTESRDDSNAVTSAWAQSLSIRLSLIRSVSYSCIHFQADNTKQDIFLKRCCEINWTGFERPRKATTIQYSKLGITLKRLLSNGSRHSSLLNSDLTLMSKGCSSSLETGRQRGCFTDGPCYGMLENSPCCYHQLCCSSEGVFFPKILSR